MVMMANGGVSASCVCDFFGLVLFKFYYLD